MATSSHTSGVPNSLRAVDFNIYPMLLNQIFLGLARQLEGSCLFGLIMRKNKSYHPAGSWRNEWSPSRRNGLCIMINRERWRLEM